MGTHIELGMSQGSVTESRRYLADVDNKELNVLVDIDSALKNLCRC